MVGSNRQVDHPIMSMVTANIRLKSAPYNALLLAGLLAGTVLIGLAVTILLQILSFAGEQQNATSGIFTDTKIWHTVLFTVYQAGLSTVISIAIGAVLAWSLASRLKFPFRRMLIALISSALVLPTLVAVLGIVTVYGRNGWLAWAYKGAMGDPLPFSIYGLTGILLAHVFLNASFAARILLHRFEAIPTEKHKLGHALGLGFWQKIKVIDWPAIAPSIPALAITIFLLCFTSFAIVLTLGGSPAYNTLEVAIYEAVKFDFDLPRAYQLAMVQISLCVLLVLISATRFSPPGQPDAVPHKSGFEHLTSKGQSHFQNLFIAGFAIFMITPLLATVLDGASASLINIFSDPTFQRAFVTSLGIACISTLLALLLSLTISSALVTCTSKTRMGNWRYAWLPELFLSLSAMLYLVFPALVMGLGFFLLFLQFGGNSISWSFIILVIANALIAVPFGVASLRPAIFSAAQKNDRLATSLGLSKSLRWRLIDWPLLKHDITYVAALAFCFSLGDLGVIALFGSEDFKTLPWLLYQKFGSYRTNDANAIALVMLALVLTIFSLAQMISTKDQNK